MTSLYRGLQKDPKKIKKCSLCVARPNPSRVEREGRWVCLLFQHTRLPFLFHSLRTFSLARLLLPACRVYVHRMLPVDFRFLFKFISVPLATRRVYSLKEHAGVRTPPWHFLGRLHARPSPCGLTSKRRRDDAPIRLLEEFGPSYGNPDPLFLMFLQSSFLTSPVQHISITQHDSSSVIPRFQNKLRRHTPS